MQPSVWLVNFPDFNFWRFVAIWHKSTNVRPSCPEFGEIPRRLMRGAQCSPEMTAAHCERGKYEINVKNNMFWILRRKVFLICLLGVYGFPFSSFVTYDNRIDMIVKSCSFSTLRGRSLRFSHEYIIIERYFFSIIKARFDSKRHEHLFDFVCSWFEAPFLSLIVSILNRILHFLP